MEPLVVRWARHADEVRQAQRLRFEVFASELGAHLQTPQPGLDVDRFDAFCEHLMVCGAESGEVLGTYRLLTPPQAQRAGGTYCDTEFDLSPLEALRPRMVELGRSCVHPAHRRGAVLLALWRELAAFMLRHGLETMVGCASLPPPCPGDATAARAYASRVWLRVRQQYLAAPQYRVQPLEPWPMAPHDAGESVEPPPLVAGYLRLGARVLGPPAWDRAFGAADLPMLMRVQDLPRRLRESA